MNKNALTPEWRTLSRAALDVAYNNAAAVPASGDIVAAWEARSRAFREASARYQELRYGVRERNRIDFFPGKPDRPTLVFFHGGYWQARSKEVFSCFAAGPLTHGLNVALVGYTLAPDATLDMIVAEAGAALDHLAAHLPTAGVENPDVIISGWSAGAHLAAMLCGRPEIQGALLISGIYDLEPVRHCYVNDKLGLDEAMAARNSPILHLPRSSPPVWVAVGGAELSELRRQSSDYAQARQRAGLSGGFVEMPGADHFSILSELESASGRLSRIVSELASAQNR